MLDFNYYVMKSSWEIDWQLSLEAICHASYMTRTINELCEHLSNVDILTKLLKEYNLFVHVLSKFRIKTTIHETRI